MVTLIKLSLRNLRRNTRRTIITASAIALGLMLMVLSFNVAFGMYQTMIRTGISTLAGHVVVQADGYNDARDADLVVGNAPAVVAAVTRAVPDAVVVQRSFFGGLLTSTRNAVAVQVLAIDPPQEARVSDWQDKLVDGEFLVQGEDRGVLLGRKLAEKLDVALGDKVVLMTNGASGDVSRLFRVSGLLKTGSSDLDGFAMMVTLDAARDLREAPDTAHQISVHIDDADQSEAARDAVAAALGRPDLEVLDWKTALPELWQGIQLDRNSNNMMMVIIGFIVALGVLNTVLMSVLERVREFGVMLALGVTPRQLAGIVLFEGLFIGTIGVALGVLLGMAASYPLIVDGLDFSAFVGDEMDYGGVATSTLIYAVPDWGRIVGFSIGGVLLTVAAAIYPALKAAQLRPVEAMRHA